MKAEVQVLLEKARQSQQAAELLLREGYPDFAAARAYYAMFYATEGLLLEHGLSFSSHAAVIGAFGREFAKPALLAPRLHRYLLDAQDYRNLGDYGIGPKVTPIQAQEVLQWTAEFLTAIETFLASCS
jgi:uncharacterized protein (UPF0332 family)